MNTRKERLVSFEEAKREVEITSRRIALLHLSYARVLIDELGEEKGKELIAKAIKYYGIRIGKKTREEILNQGLKPLPENFREGKLLRIPKFGMHDRIETVEFEDEPRRKAYGCKLAALWKEYGEDKLGRFYCYVDPAKYMAYNPNYKLVHIKAVPDGHEYCEFAIRPTTEKERSAFSTEGKDWFFIDE